MTTGRAGRSMGWVVAALVLVGLTACSSTVAGSDASPPHTEPTDPAALLVSPPDELHPALEQAIGTAVAQAPVVDEDGTSRVVYSRNAWLMGWTTDSGSYFDQVDEMASTADARRLAEALGADIATQEVAAGAHRSRFEVPGVGGAVAISIDPPPDRPTTYVQVIAPVGIYVLQLFVIADGTHGRALMVQMAQMQADHLRQLG